MQVADNFSHNLQLVVRDRKPFLEGVDQSAPHVLPRDPRQVAVRLEQFLGRSARQWRAGDVRTQQQRCACSAPRRRDVPSPWPGYLPHQQKWATNPNHVSTFPAESRVARLRRRWPLAFGNRIMSPCPSARCGSSCAASNSTSGCRRPWSPSPWWMAAAPSSVRAARARCAPHRVY